MADADRRRVIAKRPHSADTTYSEPDGEIPDVDRYVDRYVDGRYVNDGQTVLEATVEGGAVQEIEVWGNCATAVAHAEADGLSGTKLRIHP